MAILGFCELEIILIELLHYLPLRRNGLFEGDNVARVDAFPEPSDHGKAELGVGKHC